MAFLIPAEFTGNAETGYVVFLCAYLPLQFLGALLGLAKWLYNFPDRSRYGIRGI
jgi:hypothetical protein